MFFQRVFAMIDENGIVQNRAVFDDYETANQISRAVYGEKAIAVECTRYKIGNEYRYIDNRFYLPDEDVEAEYVPDYEEQAAMIQESFENVVEDNVDIDFRMTCLELGL